RLARAPRRAQTCSSQGRRYFATVTTQVRSAHCATRLAAAAKLKTTGDILETGAMFQILLIRPGGTENDQQGRIQGTLDIPLGEDGRKQVEAMIEQLRGKPIEMIYTGPGQSATQTADVLGEALDIKVKEIDKLQNLNFGLWQGMLVNDVKKKQPTVYR